jgi:hypothetical protein
MNRSICSMVVAILACPPAAVAASDATKPGLVSVYFLGADFTRAAEMSVRPRIDHDTGRTIHDYSQLWMGSLRVPTDEAITFSAEADNGCRLLAGRKVVLDGLASPRREGRLTAKKGQLLPFRLEFFQDGGVAYMRLYWSWKGHTRELIPAEAFSHSDADETDARHMLATGKAGGGAATQDTASPNAALVYGTPQCVAHARPSGPMRLEPGPQLFLDEYLIESSDGLVRKVCPPLREAKFPNPIITGPEDRCFQPFFTVSRSPEAGTFRIWYGARRDDKSTGRSRIAYMESDDGVHWKRPARLLHDFGQIQFGSEVLDAGPNCPDPERRYIYCYYLDWGTRFAASPDGLRFTPMTAGVVLPHGHDISSLWRDPLRGRYVATISEMLRLPHMGEPRRTTLQSTSDDLLHWSPPWIVLAADNRYDRGVLQFYAMNGYLTRGGLVIGMVKNLHDDDRAKGGPPGTFGVGSMSLAWTHDGRTWVRDREVFFAPDPKPGAWDHAHAWIDEQVPVRDEVFLYYGGYRWGHKHERFRDRQIGLVTMRRDRYVARQAGPKTATLRTVPLVLTSGGLTVNAKIDGELAVRLIDTQGRAVPGCDWTELRGDRVDHPVAFAKGVSATQGRVLRLEFRLRDASLFAFDVLPPKMP